MDKQSSSSIGGTKVMATIAVMTALTCIFGPLSIPIGPIPISLTLLYLLIGLAGVPVFSGFTAGPAKLFGPTGGYLIGFILMALISGYFIDKFPGKYAIQFTGMLLGLFALYALGTFWLAYSAGMTLQAAFAAGVAPFILLDVLKLVLSMALGTQIRHRLGAAGFAVWA